MSEPRTGKQFLLIQELNRLIISVVLWMLNTFIMRIEIGGGAELFI
jgi:hypothetical protein